MNAECTADPSRIVEHEDAIAHLERQGFGPLLDALRDPDNHTRNGDGRPVLSKLARQLNMKRRQVEAMIGRARKALE